jgi:hypothetical protein
MHQHLYTFLNHRFGIKSLITEWAQSIIVAVDKFSDVDCEVAVFGRCLQNLVDGRGLSLAYTRCSAAGCI